MPSWKKILKALVLSAFFGDIYCFAELLFRGYTHWTMFLLSWGLCAVIGSINEVIPWKIAFWKQVLLGAALITLAEFIAGCVLNLWLGLGIWDYSNQPFNLLGQICPQFFLLWCLAAVPLILLDDWGKYILFDADRPHYTIL